MVKDSEALNKAIPMIIELSKDESRQNELKKNISKLAIVDADSDIADILLKAIK
jgi:UDP-N-acetylglucosamine--N-acetylmuramyl-(pentapeptide) pyrophosphoryl-undecaprenol N-acetylglucosamine transferase